MKIALFAYSRQGCRTARAVMSFFHREDIRAYTPQRFGEEDFYDIRRPAKPFYGELFSWADALVFIGSCAIAVRAIAPHIKNKQTDPAVICIDELGHFAISLLSGHIGGANEMTLKIAKQLDAVAVITTATDINRRFSVDSWAVKNGLIIDDIHHVKAVSAAILEEDIPLSCDFDITTELPNSVVLGDSGKVGICISCYKKSPFKETLRLIPPILHLGIGCRKGISDSAICKAVKTVFAENALDEKAIKCVASLELKSNEAGLLKYCEDNGFEPVFYSAEQLNKVSGEFTSSAFVRDITGLDNICERAALLGADRLIVKKTALNGVTVAVAIEKLEVRFG